MKNVFFFVALVLVFLSCKKSASPKQGNNQQSNGTVLVRIQGGIDSVITNDTVYLVSYNSQNKISVVLDSLYQDSLSALYDSAGNLAYVIYNGPGGSESSAFVYDGNGNLTQINSVVAGDNDQYNFEYVNGAVSRKSFYSDYGQGNGLQLRTYDDYVVTGGNITGLKEYDGASNNLLSETTFTYGTETNPFKSLSLFNLDNVLYSNYIINYETYFNKNILTGSSTAGMRPVIMTNTFNADQYPTKILINDTYYEEQFTWSFTYR